MKRYSTIIQSKIIELDYAGLSARKIAKELNIGKSGVIDFLTRIYGSRGNIRKVKEVKPKILLLDIETAPSIAAVFGRFKVNITQDHVIKEGTWLLSYAYKWLGENKVTGNVLTPSEAVAANDYRLLVDILDLLEAADVVIWHNGDNFDFPIIKTRLIINHLPPCKKIKSIDTLKIAKEFRFNSNKLDSLCKQLSLDGKVQHRGISLWRDCLEGNEQALKDMLHYNKGDIPTLEEVYKIIRPYSTKHPNLALFYPDDAVRCNICGSKNISETGNILTTNLSAFTEHVCNDCKARFKSRKSITTKEQRSKYLSN